jgi:hypothetical protein
MEVAVPVMAPSAPCSPRTALPAGYCHFFSSAPTSPSRASYAAGDGDGAMFDFTLGFSGQLREATPILAAADELFEGGRIRPLNAPRPSVLLANDDTTSSSHSFPRRAARAGQDRQAAEASSERGGRPSASAASSSRSSRRAARSLSPFRAGGESPSSPPASSMMRGCGSKKWRLRDLFLFRSVSEGRAAGSCKDPLFKYAVLSQPSSLSQRLKTAGDGGSASMRRGRGSTALASDVPPYTANRAAAEDVRRRATTPLPFHRNSLFGYLRSNPAIHSISRKLGGGTHSSYSNSNRSRTA